MPVRPSPSPAATPRSAVLSVLFALAACANSGSDVVTPPVQQGPALLITDTSPGQGELGVSPSELVTVTFAEPVSSLSDEIALEDGAGVIGSYLEPNLDGTVWRVHPVQPLPLGALVGIRVRAGTRAVSGARLPADVVRTFTVRDTQIGAAIHRGPGEASFARAMLWNSGPGVVLSGATFVRIDEANTFQMPVSGDVIGAAQDQIGAFVALTRSGLSPFLVEGLRGAVGGSLLTGSIVLAPAAYGRCELAVNARGDAVAYCFGTQSSGIYESLWAQRPGVSGWYPVDLVAGGSYPLRRVGVDGFGNPFVVWLDDATGRLRLQRTDLQFLPAQTFDVAGMPIDYQVAAQGNGDCRVLWTDRQLQNGQDVQIRYARRYTFEQGLGPTIELTRGEPWTDRAFAACDTGAAVAVFERPLYGDVFLQRFEADGAVGEPILVADAGLPLVHSLAMSQRGYAVLAFVVPDPIFGDQVRVVVSRPGEAMALPRIVYTVDLESTHVLKVNAAIDDRGRVLLAIVEAGPQSPLSLYSVSLQ